MGIFCYAMNYTFWIIDLFVSSVLTCFCFEPKNKKVSMWKYIVGLFFVQFPFVTIKFIFTWQPWLRNFGMFFTILSALVYTIILSKGYIWQKILFVVFRIICCCMAEWIVQLVLYDTLLQTEELYFDQPIMVVYLAFLEILYIVFFLLFMLIWKKLVLKKGYDLKIFFVFVIFPISQVILLTNINQRVFTEMTPASMAAIIGLVLGIAADILLMILLLRQQSMYEMEVKLNEIEKAWEIEQNHYRDIESRREELAKIRHDISEQFIVMQELLHKENSEKVMEMLYTLREYVASTKEYEYCADPVVNAIMSENERECRKRGIQFKYSMEIMQPLHINPVAICSIFSNLMRNALAAAMEVEDKSKAIIEIRAAIKGAYLVVKVDNAFSEEKKKIKKNRKGYGLDILQSLVEQYHGQMDIVAENGNYSTRISVENIDISENYKIH